MSKHWRTSAFRLGRRHLSSPQWCYLHHLHTTKAPKAIQHKDAILNKLIIIIIMWWNLINHMRDKVTTNHFRSWRGFTGCGTPSHTCSHISNDFKWQMIFVSKPQYFWTSNMWKTMLFSTGVTVKHIYCSNVTWCYNQWPWMTMNLCLFLLLIKMHLSLKLYESETKRPLILFHICPTHLYFEWFPVPV